MIEQFTVYHWLKSASKLYMFSLIILVSISQIATAQNLLGKYGLEYKEGELYSNVYFEFFDNNQIEYFGSNPKGHFGGAYGKGTYQLKDNKLLVDMSQTRKINNSYHIIAEKRKTDKDYVVLNFEIMDLDSIKIPNGVVIVDFKNRIGKESDENGFASFKLKKSTEPNEMSVSFTTFKNHNFKFTPDADYNIKVYLGRQYGYEIGEEVWTYDLEEISDDHLVIKKNNSEIQKWRKIKNNNQ